MRNRFKCIALFMAFSVLISGLYIFKVSEDENVERTAAADKDDSVYSDYEQYVKEIGISTASDTDIQIPVTSFISDGDSGVAVQSKYSDLNNIVLWKSGNGSIVWKFYVENDGLYNFQINFLTLKTADKITLGLLIDGEYPFNKAEKLVFSLDWVNKVDEIREDSTGDQLASEQVVSTGVISRLATDDTGIEINPYCFALAEGWHTLTLEGQGYSIVIESIAFVSPEKICKYDASAIVSHETDVIVDPIVIQAEDATVKNAKTLIQKSENSDAGMTPASPYNTKINAIGGTNWNTPGQKITWEFSVEKSGYYSFGTRFKQNELINGESCRWLKIDGNTPFAEAMSIRFPYKTGWQYYEFGNDNGLYYIYLDQGKHTVSLEVTLGDLSDYYDRLSKIVNILGDLYLQIVMITGESPDTNRDYELFRQIPDLNDILSGCDKDLASIVEDMKELTGKRGSQYTSAINNMRLVIGKMTNAPYIAHIYVKDFYNNYTTITSWLSEMKEMPLTLDELRFAYIGSDFGWEKAGFLEKLSFGFKRLVNSYTKDYSTGLSEVKDGLKIWINWGRDQTMALDALIKDSFTDETGIDVELQIVSNSLINGLLSGKFPDLQLNLARTEPVNLGIRGALCDLSDFEDCEEVLERFQTDAELPYRYKDALYALPDTQSFFCVFYRTDVFQRLGLSVPETWDDFLDCATIIQRYNMSVYVPYTQITTTTTVNTGPGGLSLYPTLMLQNNLSLYNQDLTATSIRSDEAIKIFEKYTKMYSDYGYLKEADFYNRFRNGSMPLGIAGYTTYMTLKDTAPEIEGRWAMANVPATVGGNNYVAGSGTGCGIVAKSSKKKEAWEFLKWWTSAETQARYSSNVESILGFLGRIATSNTEAFENLSWDPNDLQALKNQWGCVREIEEIPGSYYLTRAIDQAFWSVLNDGTNAKDALSKWSLIADKEIERKTDQYS